MKIFRDAVWTVLMGHWTDPIPVPVMQEIRQIETWILTLLSSPVPVPGKTKVALEVIIKNHKVKICIFTNLDFAHGHYANY
jgi:hypothetical protein